MANKVQLHMKGGDQGYVFLDDLQPGFGGPLMVMINRRWDVCTAKGTYLSTDFIISDQKGNLMHGISTHNRAHKFLEKVKEGFVYMLSGFKVQPNRKDFQMIQDSPYILEFNGSTTAEKAVGDVNSFVRYRFQIISFEELVSVDSKYLVGELGISSTSSTQIIDSPDVPALNSFIIVISNQDLSQIPLEKVDTVFMLDTLAELMKWGREWKNGMHSDDGRVVFKCTVEIVGIRTRNGW